MSLDELARAAAADLRQSTSRSLDPDDMLQRLHRARSRRTAAALAGLVAVVAVVVLVGGAVAVGDRADAPPAETRHKVVRLPSDVCDRAAVTCLGGRVVRVRLATPLTVRIPDTFQPQVVVSSRVAEFYRADVFTTGVTVAQSAVPVRYDASWERDVTAGTTAESMAEWLAGRSFLTDTTLTRRSAGGPTAWEVSGSYRTGAQLSARRGGRDLAPTFSGSHATMGYSPVLAGTYTLVDQADGGVTVIWSWAFGSGPKILTGNQGMVDEILAAL
jgi:hypothetical protein